MGLVTLDPPEVVVEEDPPKEVVVEEDPPRSGGARDPPRSGCGRGPPKTRTRPDQLRSTAGQAGGMPQKKGFLVCSVFILVYTQLRNVATLGGWLPYRKSWIH